MTNVSFGKRKKNTKDVKMVDAKGGVGIVISAPEWYIGQPVVSVR
jgi:hypothetical protein